MDHGTSSAFRRELLETVQLHIDARVVEAKRQFNMVSGTGILLAFFGSLSFWALSEFREQTRADRSLLYMAAYMFPVLLVSLGTVIFSLSPVDQFDIDICVASYPRIRTIACLVLLLSDPAEGPVGGVDALKFSEYFQCDYEWFGFFFMFMLEYSTIFVILFGGSNVHEHGTPKTTTLLVCYTFAYNLRVLPVWLFYRGISLSNVVSPCFSWVYGNWMFTPLAYYASSLFYFIGTVIIFVRWYRNQFMKHRNPSLGHYQFHYEVYGWLLPLFILHRGTFLLFSDEADVRFHGVTDIILSAIIAAPNLLVLVLGREAMFGFMVRRFDRSQYTYEGRILANLYAREYKVGDTFWLSAPSLAPFIEQSNDSTVHDENWLTGLIRSVDIASGVMGVDVYIRTRCLTVEVPRPPKQTPEELLLDNEIRCIDWPNISFNDMLRYDSRSVNGTPLYELSRPLRKGEKIDYFVSHSWRDDQRKKWNLGFSRCAVEFYNHTGRWPTFWIDKYCLRSDAAASDGLKCLCMYIRACDRMLVICGPTFSTRLWCAWEIFTLFAFQSESEVLKRIDLVLLDEVYYSSEGWNSKALTALEMFSVTAAKCYDPNDRNIMTGIIDGLGRCEFDSKIQRMARYMKQKTRARLHVNRGAERHSSGLLDRYQNLDGDGFY